MLTIFSTPKPFRGHSSIIQRNALKSWTLVGQGAPPGRLLLVSAAVVVVEFLTGAAYFQKMESTIADIV